MLVLSYFILQYDKANFSRVEFYVMLERKSLFFITYTVYAFQSLELLIQALISF